MVISDSMGCNFFAEKKVGIIIPTSIPIETPQRIYSKNISIIPIIASHLGAK
jgi:hypothetical protein